MAIRDHRLRVVPQEDAEEEPLAHEEKHKALGMTWLNELAAGAFVEGDKAALLALVKESARSLGGEAGPDAHARMLARETAIAAAAVDILTASLGERLRAKDLRGALVVDRLLTSATKRFAALFTAHSARPTVLAIGHSVTVGEA